MSALDEHPKGDKVHRHFSIYARYDAILDGIVERHGCSRSEAVEALLADYANGLRAGTDMLLAERKEPTE